MFSLWFALKRIIRRPFVSLGTVLLCGAFALLLLGLGGYRDYQVVALANVYDNMAVMCTVTNKTGLMSDKLHINSTAYEQFTDPENYPLAGFCTDLLRVKEFKYIQLNTLEYMSALMGEDAISEEELIQSLNFTGAKALVTADSFESINALASYSGAPIELDEGYDKDFLLGTEAVCIAPYSLWSRLVADENGERLIRIVIYDQECQRTYKDALDLKVIGYYYSENVESIYMPFLVGIEANDREGIYRSCDSLSFTLNDNRRLDEFITVLREKFPEPDISETNPMFWDFAVIVHDAELRESVDAIMRDQSLAETFIPVLLALSMVAGVVISMLCVRSGKRGYAVMRSLGTKPAAVFAAALLEQLILLIVGSGLCTLIYAIAAEITKTGLMSLLLFVAVYALGCAVMMIGTNTKNVMNVMKED